MRWIIRAVFAVIVIVALAVGALFLIPADKIAAAAIAKFNSLTGRELTISGSVRPSIWPQLGVRTGPISISNAAWSKEGPMLQADGLSIALDMAALMGGEVKITAVEAIAPKIVLERSAKGEQNWMFGGDNGGTVSTETPGVGAAFTLDKGLIGNGTLLFVDHGTGQRFELTGIDATVAIPSYTGPARVDLAAALNGQPFAAGLSVGAFQPFLDGQLVPVDLTLKAGASDLAFKGRGGYQPLLAEGDLNAKLGDLSALAALAGAAAPALPEGLGARQVAVAGAVTLTAESSLHLRGGQVVLDGNALSVDADLLTAGDRPKLSAKVTAGALDLSALAGGQGGGSGGGAQATGWPTMPIDVSGLRLLDATVALSADALNLGLVKFGPSQIMATVDAGRAVFDIRKVAAYDGGIAGQFVVNARKGLSIGGELSFAGMALQPLLQDFGGYDRLLGTGDMRVKFLGSGRSVDAIMQSLEGSGTIALSKGEIRGLDIAGMLRTLDTGYVGEGQKTIFDALGGSFTITGGVLSNDDLALQSPYVTANGKGRIGLGARDLDYRISATALADAEGKGGLTAPLLITGPWAAPRFSLDLQALADQQLADQKAALEAQAKAKAAELEAEAKAKLQSELGVVPQEGESLEDAAKRRANEALDAEARKALEQLLNGGAQTGN